MSLSPDKHIELQEAPSTDKEFSADSIIGNNLIHEPEKNRAEEERIRIYNLLRRGDPVTINKNGNVEMSATENTDKEITIPVPDISEILPIPCGVGKLAGPDKVEHFVASEKLGFPPPKGFSEKKQEKKRKELYRQFTRANKKELEEERVRLRNLLLSGDIETADKCRDVESSANEKADNETTIYVPSVPKTIPIFSGGPKLAGPDNDPWIDSDMNSK